MTVAEEAFELLAGLVYCQGCSNEIKSVPPDFKVMKCNILDHRTDNISSPFQCEWFRARLV